MLMQSAHENMMRWWKISIFFLVAFSLGALVLAAVNYVWHIFVPLAIVESVLFVSFVMAWKFKNQWKNYLTNFEGGEN